ncbi:MAG: cyclic lactone autoinducer peptide [Bacillota bacterium]
MRRIKYLVLAGLTAALVLLAQVAAASACLWGHYQPEVPDKLAKY